MMVGVVYVLYGRKVWREETLVNLPQYDIGERKVWQICLAK